ncbi:hypothetical protein BDN72DRAFT_574001 [Pluteus cervinus]|uniref:Uncharacterized protein n=1 Tax=Pluteus cervinus TaxID=181527 RepID=A0ACD3A2F9_9AGAR|nr:hypothetical protein BDN72DRAFT_574001 [Pluteus cervinus]
MSEPQSSYPFATYPYNGMDYGQQQQQLEDLAFPSYLPDADDARIQTAESFEGFVDSLPLAGLDDDVVLCTITNTFIRSETPTRPPGPPSISTLTTSSESTHDVFSSSFSSYPSSNFSGFNMEGLHLNVGDAVPAFGYQSAQIGITDTVNSFGSLPASPTDLPPLYSLPLPVATHHNVDYYEGQHTSSSDYAPAGRYSNPFEYSNSSQPQATVSPSDVSMPSIPTAPTANQRNTDPKKRFKCPTCHLGFARAFNLKTHMGIHDPNRIKPWKCPHRSCRRPFSRKHDLRRHLFSIHREEPAETSFAQRTKVSTSTPSIGIGINQGPRREWCDTCGRGCVGSNTSCMCYEFELAHKE